MAIMLPVPNGGKAEGGKADMAAPVDEKRDANCGGAI
jgi:hypothetical protein